MLTSKLFEGNEGTRRPETKREIQKSSVAEGPKVAKFTKALNDGVTNWGRRHASEEEWERMRRSEMHNLLQRNPTVPCSTYKKETLIKKSVFQRHSFKHFLKLSYGTAFGEALPKGCLRGTAHGARVWSPCSSPSQTRFALSLKEVEQQCKILFQH